MIHDKFTLGTEEYRKEFWNDMMSGGKISVDLINKAKILGEMCPLPYYDNNKYMEALAQESLFRRYATCIPATDSDFQVNILDNKSVAKWELYNIQNTVKNDIEVYKNFPLNSHKLSILTKIDASIFDTNTFDIEKYFIKQFAKAFGKTEENAFINGDGKTMPYGILHKDEGATISKEVNEVTFDNLLEFFFTLDSDYRKDAVWLMNDKTALFLHKLKDSNGNYIWNHNSEKIMGKPVMISNFMPDMESGNTPIAFGDLSHYWIVDRRLITVKSLHEIYCLKNQIGYLAETSLDARLGKKDAIKLLKIS